MVKYDQTHIDYRDLASSAASLFFWAISYLSFVAFSSSAFSYSLASFANFSASNSSKVFICYPVVSEWAFTRSTTDGSISSGATSGWARASGSYSGSSDNWRRASSPLAIASKSSLWAFFINSGFLMAVIIAIGFSSKDSSTFWIASGVFLCAALMEGLSFFSASS